MATELDADTAAIEVTEVTERGDRLTLTIRDGHDVVVVRGTPGTLLGLAQSLRSVVALAAGQ